MTGNPAVFRAMFILFEAFSPHYSVIFLKDAVGRRTFNVFFEFFVTTPRGYRGNIVFFLKSKKINLFKGYRVMRH